MELEEFIKYYECQSNYQSNAFYQYMHGADIPYGFQDMSPDYFSFIASLVGQIIASNLPFNVQNAIGNWLQLAGQFILTYNAQQQYFQGGPGRYYNLNYKNVTNPFAPGNTSTETDGAINASSNTNSSSNENLIEIIQKMQKEIDYLKNKIE